MAEKNLPVELQATLDIVKQQHAGIRAELDILRKTRSQREVGSLKVPAHLSAAAAIVTIVPGQTTDPRQCPGCGKGIDTFAASRGEKVCTRCANNPNTEAGVEQRVALAAVSGS